MRKVIFRMRTLKFRMRKVIFRTITEIVRMRNGRMRFACESHLKANIFQKRQIDRMRKVRMRITYNSQHFPKKMNRSHANRSHAGRM